MNIEVANLIANFLDLKSFVNLSQTCRDLYYILGGLDQYYDRFINNNNTLRAHKFMNVFESNEIDIYINFFKRYIYSNKIFDSIIGHIKIYKESFQKICNKLGDCSDKLMSTVSLFVKINCLYIKCINDLLPLFSDQEVIQYFEYGLFFNPFLNTQNIARLIYLSLTENQSLETFVLRHTNNDQNEYDINCGVWKVLMDHPNFDIKIVTEYLLQQDLFESKKFNRNIVNDALLLLIKSDYTKINPKLIEGINKLINDYIFNRIPVVSHKIVKNESKKVSPYNDTVYNSVNNSKRQLSPYNVCGTNYTSINQNVKVNQVIKNECDSLLMSRWILLNLLLRNKSVLHETMLKGYMMKNNNFNRLFCENRSVVVNTLSLICITVSDDILDSITEFLELMSLEWSWIIPTNIIDRDLFDSSDLNKFMTYIKETSNVKKCNKGMLSRFFRNGKTNIHMINNIKNSASIGVNSKINIYNLDIVRNSYRNKKWCHEQKINNTPIYDVEDRIRMNETHYCNLDINFHPPPKKKEKFDMYGRPVKRPVPASSSKHLSMYGKPISAPPIDSEIMKIFHTPGKPIPPLEFTPINAWNKETYSDQNNWSNTDINIYDYIRPNYNQYEKRLEGQNEINQILEKQQEEKFKWNEIDNNRCEELNKRKTAEQKERDELNEKIFASGHFVREELMEQEVEEEDSDVNIDKIISDSFIEINDLPDN